ncbi:MAG: DUF6644 family protein [Janthinobacterium lividum]
MLLPHVPQSIIQATTSLPLSQFIRESSWAFPTIESIHVVAVVVVVGTITIVDLRLVGIAYNNCAVTQIARDTLKWTWGAFLLALISGSLMAMAKLNAYVVVPSFWIKFGFMAAAAVNMLVFELLTFRNVHTWDQGCAVPTAAKIAGTLSIVLWAIVIIFGRWIGYTIDYGSVFGGGF